MHTETNQFQHLNAAAWLERQWANVLRLRREGYPIVGFTWYSRRGRRTGPRQTLQDICQVLSAELANLPPPMWWRLTNRSTIRFQSAFCVISK